LTRHQHLARRVEHSPPTLSLGALAVNEYSPDESGTNDFAIEPTWGCFLWIASMGLMLTATVLARAVSSRPESQASPASRISPTPPRDLG